MTETDTSAEAVGRELRLLRARMLAAAEGDTR